MAGLVILARVVRGDADGVPEGVGFVEDGDGVEAEGGRDAGGGDDGGVGREVVDEAT